ncbi:MAG: tRNA pseudouridine(38-40) synthase TruA [Butyricicoccaceae bacterium]
MTNYKLTIAYDGSRYNGWQRQGNTQNTIQQKIEDILTRMAGHAIEIHGAGRTDAGVHAIAQIAHFKAALDCPPEEIQRSLNRYLPSDIAVTACEPASERFHARLNAVGKHYRYRIQNSSIPNVFERKYMVQDETPLDLDAMRRAAAFLCGTHDFRAFSSVNKRFKKSTVRTITRIDIERIGAEMRLDFYGNGFLYNMVRILTGTLLAVGKGTMSPTDIPVILDSLDRQSAGITMPPQGLTLVEVFYS